jgi:hypothetical protein
MDRVFESRSDEFPAVGDWAPSLDLSETKDVLLLKMEVPGMDAKDIHVSFQNGVLAITMPKTPAAKGTTIPVKSELARAGKRAKPGADVDGHAVGAIREDRAAHLRPTRRVDTGVSGAGTRA